MPIRWSLLFSPEMATVRICVFYLLFLSQAWAEEGELEMVNIKQLDKSKMDIPVDLWAELKELKDLVIEQKIELSKSKSKIEKLEKEKTENPRVAFSLGLSDSGTTGPFPFDMRLTFKKILTNFGQAYDTDTGIFMAPVRGVYYFRFTAFSMSANRGMGAILYHNSKKVGWITDHNDDVGYATASNGFVLQLEKGDAVYLVLPPNYVLYDGPDNRTVFSGFLIFPL